MVLWRIESEREAGLGAGARAGKREACCVSLRDYAHVRIVFFFFFFFCVFYSLDGFAFVPSDCELRSNTTMFRVSSSVKGPGYPVNQWVQYGLGSKIVWG